MNRNTNNDIIAPVAPTIAQDPTNYPAVKQYREAEKQIDLMFAQAAPKNLSSGIISGLGASFAGLGAGCAILLTAPLVGVSNFRHIL